MNPARTLAERFRTQRTDRIRVDGSEVISVLEIRIDAPTVVEIVVESHRSDIDQRFIARTRCAESHITSGADGSEKYAIGGELGEPLEFLVVPEHMNVLQLWNSWIVDGACHAWTGNAGMIVDELETPPTAVRRLRLWCSDGLGNADFGDMVVVVTLGSAEASSPG